MLKLEYIYNSPNIISNKVQKEQLLNEFHAGSFRGEHFGQKKMLSRIRTQFKWKNMSKDVANFIRNCEQCKRNKPKYKTIEPLKLSHTPKKPFDVVQIDTIGPLQTSTLGNNYAITITCELTKYLKAFGVSIDNWNPMLTFIITSKLDLATMMHYECQLTDVRELQNLSDLLKYMESRFMALQSIDIRVDAFGGNRRKFEKPQESKTFNKPNNGSNNNSEKTMKCIYCKENHSVFDCSEFAKKDAKKRFFWIRKAGRCYVCFGIHEGECKHKKMCEICGKNHHKLLHFTKKSETSKEKQIKANVVQAELIENESGDELEISANTAKKSNGSVLLATAMVSVYDVNGR